MQSNRVLYIDWSITTSYQFPAFPAFPTLNFYLRILFNMSTCCYHSIDYVLSVCVYGLNIFSCHWYLQLHQKFTIICIIYIFLIEYWIIISKCGREHFGKECNLRIHDVREHKTASIINGYSPKLSFKVINCNGYIFLLYDSKIEWNENECIFLTVAEDESLVAVNVVAFGLNDWDNIDWFNCFMKYKQSFDIYIKFVIKHNR